MDVTMLVGVIVIACVVLLAVLVALVVLLLDRNATLRTVELKAQAWKSINIAFRIVRDASKSEHARTDVPTITDSNDADTVSNLTTTAPRPDHEPLAAHASRPRRQSARSRPSDRRASNG